MTTYISILRGINVSGHRMIKMDALRRLYTDMGFTEVHTYIQSGNVVFQGKKAKPHELEQKISEQIKEVFGHDVPVIVIAIEALKKIVKHNPYIKDKAKDTAHLHITFLSDKPAKEGVDNVKAGSYGADEFEYEDQAIYLYCPGGYGNTKLTNSFWESKLKVTATTRNWKTANELIAIAEKIINA